MIDSEICIGYQGRMEDDGNVFIRSISFLAADILLHVHDSMGGVPTSVYITLSLCARVFPSFSVILIVTI